MITKIVYKLLRNRGLGVNLLAGLSFILLMVFGFGLAWGELTRYLFIFLSLIAILIGLAALCGWVLRKIIDHK